MVSLGRTSATLVLGSCGGSVGRAEGRAVGAAEGRADGSGVGPAVRGTSLSPATATAGPPRAAEAAKAGDP